MAKNHVIKLERPEAQLFKAADKLRKNIDAAEYKLKNLREILLPKLMSGEVKLLPAENRDDRII